MNDHSKTVAAPKRRGYEAGAVADGTDWLVVKPTAHPGSLADVAASRMYLKGLLV